MKKILTLILISLSGLPAYANPTINLETKTSHYFESIKSDPLQLYMFLRKFPKGGDLHNHLAGAIYAEDLINYSKNDHFCIDNNTFVASINPQCPIAQQLANAPNNPPFYRSIVNTWSMSDFMPGTQSGESHFFATFFKFIPVVGYHTGQLLSAVVSRAGADNIDYLELMIDAKELGLNDKADDINTLANQVGWDSNLAQLRQKLLQQGLDKIVAKIPERLNNAEKALRTQLQCDTANADTGCGVKVRYLYYAVREFSPVQVFANLLAGFEVAKRDPRFVGVNIVAPEEGPTAVKDYKLHMQMFNYLHQIYPQVHISLHAGELASTNVPPEILRNHIRQAIEIGHAERIGHGVSVAYEDNAGQLLQAMAAKKIMVEINLTSNLSILGIAGKQHPLPLYMRYHVPVALSTDDEGVLRTELTREYQRAVLTYNLDYSTLKQLSRNSIIYSFLPATEKAQLQQQLEQQFEVFENNFKEA